jgi:hypothetical protein
MEYEIIKFNNYDIYKIKVDGIDKNQTIYEFDLNSQFLGKTGCADTIMSPTLRNAYTACYNAIESIYKNVLDKKIVSGYQSGWMLSCDAKDNTGDFHLHKRLSNKYPEIECDYVWTYYLETPNNCVGNEGHLILKENDKIFSFFPEEGYLYTFKSSILHRGQEAPNSTKKRIVIVGNISFYYE